MNVRKEFDYIIVGAGSAGCVLAARLSEDPNNRVALVEAGGSDDAPEITTPLAFPSLFKTSYDWDFESEPEPHLGRRRISLPRGKTLGGSPSINTMIYVRGNAADFDEWANDGARGWSYRDLLPYFIKSECNERGDPRYHGHAGPLSVQDSRSMHPLVDHLIEAGVNAGYVFNDDFNGPSQMGIGRFQLTQRNGVRCSAASAYLHPVRDRANLQIFTDSLVLKVVLDKRRARAISIHRHGHEEILFSEREIIVAAGTYGSPQILMLSGIGLPDQLTRFGIPLVVDLPVGANLQDHPLLPIDYFTNEKSLFSAGSAEDLALYQEGRGPLTSNMAEGGVFLSTHGDENVPDCEFLLAPVMYFDEGLSAPFADGMGVAITILKPTSRGTVMLRSARPDAKPRINHNFLTTDRDRSTMLSGVRRAMDLLNQPSLSQVRRAPFLVPASDNESDIMEFIEQRTGSIYHPTSTCAIGRVVDPELRVFGVEGLRVADASVMPSIVRGHTNAGVIAMAERAAAILLGNDRSYPYFEYELDVTQRATHEPQSRVYASRPH
jgi:choline dehydrogenase-like flavoprotein